ncbi:hypothetical protein [Streptomyces sp. NPDC054804]
MPRRHPKRTDDSDPAPRDLLRLPVGERAGLDARPADARPAGPDDKAAARTATAELSERLAGLYERLWAAGTAGDRAIGRLLLEHLEELDPRHPKADFDVAECRERPLRTR